MNGTSYLYNGSGWAVVGGVTGVDDSVEYIATAGQTTFLATYTVGSLNVFLNGVKLDAADYTATNGTSVVLAAGAALNDNVFIQSFGSFELASGGGAMELIQAVELTAVAADINFTGLNNNYTSYKLFYSFTRVSTAMMYIMYRGMVDGAIRSGVYSYEVIVDATSDFDTGPNYTSSTVQWCDGATASGELTFFGIGESNTTLTSHGHGIMANRASSPYVKNNIHSGQGLAQTGTWDGISFKALFEDFPIGTKVSLYGIKG
jgi:hypothetical protein